MFRGSTTPLWYGPSTGHTPMMSRRSLITAVKSLGRCSKQNSCSWTFPAAWLTVTFWLITCNRQGARKWEETCYFIQLILRKGAVRRKRRGGVATSLSQSADQHTVRSCASLCRVAGVLCSSLTPPVCHWVGLLQICSQVNCLGDPAQQPLAT